MLSVRIQKANSGLEPWRSAYLRNEAKFVVALDVGGTATLGGASAAPLHRECGKNRHRANAVSSVAGCRSLSVEVRESPWLSAGVRQSGSQCDADHTQILQDAPRRRPSPSEQMAPGPGRTSPPGGQQQYTRGYL